jgi:hypothetical protein
VEVLPVSEEIPLQALVERLELPELVHLVLLLEREVLVEQQEQLEKRLLMVPQM